MLFRRSLRVLSAERAGRTVVRDPRRRTRLAKSLVPMAKEDKTMKLSDPPSMPSPIFLQKPTQQQHESLAASMGSYAVAGIGVALGVTLVRVVLGF